MIPLYTDTEYENTQANDKLTLECHECHKPFQKHKRYIISYLKYGSKHGNQCKYCSKKCKNKAQTTKKYIICKQCGKEFYKQLCVIKKTKNNFCNSSCAATYNNTHKTKGTRRSKLEVWIEEQLSNMYPSIDILFNDKKAINSELDIFIPSLNLAFEINGIYHYEPIHGQEKLSKVQNNDNRKFQACLDKNIEFCIIDSSGLKYFKPANAQKYLDIILHVMRQKQILNDSI